jgi:AraC family transcriptional regulator
MMKNKQVFIIDYTKESDSSQVVTPHYFKSYETGSTGVRMCHVVQEGGETPVMITPNHVLCIHLRPEFGSERRIGDRLQAENVVNVGDVAIIPAGADHWQGIEQETVEGIVISLKPHVLTDLAQDSIAPTSIEMLPTFAQADPLIYGIGLNLKAELELSENCGSPYAEALIDALCNHLLKHYSTHSPAFKQYRGGLNRDRLRAAIDYIQAHLDEKLTLDAIAQHLNMSVYHFCDLFKQSVGIAPYKYVLQQRVERAKHLLKDEERAIVDIALECGFANQTHLNKHFRKFTGMTPNSYRQQ